MGPAQFETQCVSNWKRLIKQSHFSQISLVEALAKFRRQHVRQRCQQLLPILRPPSPFLLEFHNMPADLPAGLYLNCINRSQHLLPCIANQFAKIAKQ